MRPVVDDELRYGWLLSQINALTVTCVDRERWYRGEDHDERLEVAWMGIVEYLYACEGPPSAPELIRAGFKAISQYFDKQYQCQGYRPGEGKRTSYYTYWDSVGRHVQSHEDLIVDRMALRQILPTLSDRQLAVLRAQAEFEDPRLAADSLGMPWERYSGYLAKARKHFYSRWFEGERPPGLWMSSARGDEYLGVRAVMAALRKRRRKALGIKNPPSVKIALDIPNEELERRYVEGSLAKLAAELGISTTGLRRYMDRAGIDRKALDVRKKIRQAQRA